MSDQHLQKIAIVGGGSAGWMTAASLASVITGPCEIVLVESEAIGTVGVGEATIPPIKLFNHGLGIDENEFVARTSGSFKLGIQFVDWSRKGKHYFHPFGTYGRDFDTVPIHQHWLACFRDKKVHDLDDYCMGWAAAARGRFAPPSLDQRTVQSTYDYAYHFDTNLYAAFLREYAEARGVQRIEGKVIDVALHTETGNIQSVTLDGGRVVDAEFFIDCSGFRGLLIEGALKTGYETWTHWLPCDRAAALGTVNVGDPVPYTRATAREAGWQWRIPLQHRTGNGYVYCSDHISDDEAAATLLANVEGEPLGEPRHLRFTTGRRTRFWNRNCLAIGLSAGFMEPLESTSLHLIQTAIRRFIALFPDRQIDPLCAEEFNRITIREYETVRDFLILHYHATQRTDSELWRYCANMSIPESLRYKLTQFRKFGRLVSDGVELFANPSWLAVYVGQDVIPQKPDPLRSVRQNPNSLRNLEHLRKLMENVAMTMPTHADYIAQHCRAGTMKLISKALKVRVWKDVDRAVFDNQILPLGRPAVLKGLVDDWPVVDCARRGHAALFDYLRGVSNDKPVSCFVGAAQMAGFFNYRDDLKGFNFERRAMTLDQLISALVDEAQRDSTPYLYAGGVNVPDHLPAFAADHINPLCGDEVDQLMSIWLGNRTRVPAHWDLPRNIACVVAGQRRFTLFPIDQVPNLYIGPLDRTLAGQPSSLVDPLAPDLERFPKFVDAMRHALVATLEPGDAIYIPSLWLHHVESLDEVGMLVNFWWREGPSHMFTPLLTLMHGLLSIRTMPQEERQAWRCLFEHYLFNSSEESLAHLPADARGVLGELDADDEHRLRQFLASRLVGAAMPPRSDE